MRLPVMIVTAMLALVASGVALAGQPPTMDGLLKAPGPDVALIFGTSDYSPGPIRVSFLVIRSDGKAIDRPQARVWIGADASSRPFVQTVATLEPVGVAGTSDSGDVTHLYVASFRIPRPGKYRIVAQPIGGEPIQGYQDLVVKPRSDSPALGAGAFPSHSPTIASTHGDLARLTTRRPPDRALLRSSIAATLRAHRPFVVVFATPKFCASRTCGPVVDVVDAVRRRFERDDIRFIHVEIYRGNDPKNGPNQWVKEWRLPSEPWIFLVGRDGRIKAKFEGSVSMRELAAAVQARLVH